MLIRSLAALVIVAAATATASAQQIQKWKTPDGKLYFGNRPPPGSVLVKQMQDYSRAEEPAPTTRRPVTKKWQTPDDRIYFGETPPPGSVYLGLYEGLEQDPSEERVPSGSIEPVPGYEDVSEEVLKRRYLRIVKREIKDGDGRRILEGTVANSSPYECTGARVEVMGKRFDVKPPRLQPGAMGFFEADVTELDYDLKTPIMVTANFQLNALQVEAIRRQAGAQNPAPTGDVPTIEERKAARGLRWSTHGACVGRVVFPTVRIRRYGSAGSILDGVGEVVGRKRIAELRVCFDGVCQTHSGIMEPGTKFELFLSIDRIALAGATPDAYCSVQR